MRALIYALLIVTWVAPPALAEARPTSVATPSYQPWLAAGLTYVPALPAGMAALATDAANPLRWRDSALFTTVNPMPGLGHVYVGEPLRGLGFLTASMSLLGATVFANVSLYQGRLPLDAPVPWQEQVRGSVNLTYLVTATALSAWAAWDAYRIAEEKNHLAPRSTP